MKSLSPSPPPISSVAFDRDDWSPPPADDNLSIPGELVYAKDKKWKLDHWPAEILEYIPPAKASQKPRYKVRFLDRMVLNITRDMFFAQEENGFVTCQVRFLKVT